MQVSGDVVRRIFDASPDAIVAIDGSGTIVVANLQAEELFGLPRTELIGAPIERLLPGSSSGQRLGPVARRADGTELAVEVRSAAIDSDQGILVAATIRALPSSGRDDRVTQIAHELTNMLYVISNFALLVERATTDPAVLADLAPIRVAVRRAGLLTSELGVAADGGPSAEAVTGPTGQAPVGPAGGVT